MRLVAPLTPGSLVRANMKQVASLNIGIARLSQRFQTDSSPLRRMNDLWVDLYGTPDFDERRKLFMT